MRLSWPWLLSTRTAGRATPCHAPPAPKKDACQGAQEQTQARARTWARRRQHLNQCKGDGQLIAKEEQVAHTPKPLHRVALACRPRGRRSRPDLAHHGRPALGALRRAGPGRSGRRAEREGHRGDHVLGHAARERGTRGRGVPRRAVLPGRPVRRLAPRCQVRQLARVGIAGRPQLRARVRRGERRGLAVAERRREELAGALRLDGRRKQGRLGRVLHRSPSGRPVHSGRTVREAPRRVGRRARAAVRRVQRRHAILCARVKARRGGPAHRGARPRPPRGHSAYAPALLPSGPAAAAVPPPRRPLRAGLRLLMCGQQNVRNLPVRLAPPLFGP